jgi:hypothetical protein
VRLVNLALSSLLPKLTQSRREDDSVVGDYTDDPAHSNPLGDQVWERCMQFVMPGIDPTCSASSEGLSDQARETR